MYLRLDFPSGQYFAAQSSDPAIPEWPPHPSRLFSALVAAAYQSPPGMTDERQAAIHWLEAADPPTITVPEAAIQPAPVSYVPPGDARKYKGSGKNKRWEHGVHRLRQPRYFPAAVMLDAPSAYYQWPADPDESVFNSLDEIAFGVTHMGTSHSMVVVSAHSGDLDADASFIPDEGGQMYLRVAIRGRLSELDRTYAQEQGVRRPVPACEPLMAYSERRGSRRRAREGALYDTVVLRLSGTMHGADTAMYLGKSLRRAVMSIMGEDAPAVVHGHDTSRHVAWLPLPDVGHRYARGLVKGVAVAIPQDTPTDIRLKILAGLHRVRELRLPDGRIAQLQPMPPGMPTPVTLRASSWTTLARVWSSVTPVVLDRPPKKLSDAKLKVAVETSLAYAGYPRPAHIEVSRYSRFQGAPPAFEVPTKIPRVHATVWFDAPVAGPLTIGRLRNYGIGLFRPLDVGGVA